MTTKAIQGLGRLGPVWVKHPMLPSGLTAILSLDIAEFRRIKLTDHPNFMQTPLPRSLVSLPCTRTPILPTQAPCQSHSWELRLALPHTHLGLPQARWPLHSSPRPGPGHSCVL